ncbi:MAG: hypothetical protein II956_11675 [Bacteroidales bacterium]|nr:hypothetical protein [Bacteroidales bacterium]
MKNLKTELIILIFLLCACNAKDAIYYKLVEVDTLLSNYNDSCAKKALNAIKPDMITNNENRAYYNLLLTRYDYYEKIIMGNKDSLINFSINYYTKNGDNHKLAYSYYFRALISFHDYSEKVLLDLKRAETFVKKTNDYALASKIYGALTSFYGNSLESEESLKYARKNFFCANKTSIQRLKTCALINLSVCYYDAGQKDSAIMCAKASEKFAAQLEPYYQAYIYSNLGTAYFESMPDLAEKYLKKSLECHTLAQTYKLLSDLYLSQNQKERAKQLWNDALKMSWDELKAEFLASKAEYEFETGDFVSFRNTKNEEISALKSSYEKKLKNKALELGKKYDFKIQEEKFRMRLVLIVSFVIGLVIIFYFFYVAKTSRLEKEKAEYKLKLRKEKDLLKKLESDLELFKADQKNKTKEISVLEKRIEQLRNDYQKTLQLGRELFEKLKKEVSPMNWSNTDVLCLLEYVSISNREFYDSLEVDYINLSDFQKLFLIVSDLLGKDDFAVCKMFALKKNSLRQKKNRISSKKIE